MGIVGAIVVASVKNAAPSEKFETGSYLVFDLSTDITDAPPAFDLGSLSSTQEDSLQLRAVIRTINAAATTVASPGS